MSTTAMTPQRIGPKGRDAAATLVRRAVRRGDRRLSAVDRGPGRRVLLAALPRALARRFDAEAAGDLDTTLELMIRGEDGRAPDRLIVVISRGRCDIRPGAGVTAKASITIGASDIVRLATGAVAWPRLLEGGRLELGGNPFVALRFPALFRLQPR
jgi:hypothetical protein